MKNKEASTEKMGTKPVKKLLLTMGIPMIISMVLQAVYNIVDSFCSCFLSHEYLRHQPKTTAA